MQSDDTGGIEGQDGVRCGNLYQVLHGQCGLRTFECCVV